MSALVTIADLLAPRRGITAVIGSGGKSTLLASGGRALADRGARVALATTTHMLPPAGIPLVRTIDELDHILETHPVAAIGTLDPATGKVSSPTCGVDALAACADYILVEADGSRCLPLKAHERWEPVVPACAARTVLMVGAGGLGSPIECAVHRPEVFRRLTGAGTGDAATPALVARAIAAEGLVDEHDLVIVNQVEDAASAGRADAFAAELHRSCATTVYAGSLRADRFQRA